jgi:hypothetical protein
VSAKLAMRVLESALPAHLKATAVALALFASDDGQRIYPSVGLVAWLVGKTPRAIRADLEALLGVGVLTAVTPRHGGRGLSTRYQMHQSALPSREKYQPKGGSRSPRIAGGNTERGFRVSDSSDSKKPGGGEHERRKSGAQNPEVGFRRSVKEGLEESTRTAAAPQREPETDPDPDNHYAVITAVVTKDILPLRLPDAELVSATEARCTKLRIPCDPATVRKAVDSALFRYYRTQRLEHDLPADPRQMYRDHLRPRRATG